MRSRTDTQSNDVQKSCHAHSYTNRLDDSFRDLEFDGLAHDNLGTILPLRRTSLKCPYPIITQLSVLDNVFLGAPVAPSNRRHADRTAHMKRLARLHRRQSRSEEVRLPLPSHSHIDI